MINFLKIALRVYNSFPITVCGELGFRIIVSGKGNAQSWGVVLHLNSSRNFERLNSTSVLLLKDVVQQNLDPASTDSHIRSKRLALFPDFILFRDLI